jgi:threonine dehydratase
MHRSFASGKTESIDKVRTIADSLGAPHTAPYSLALCRRFVDELVMVDDDLLCAGMAALFQEGKLAVEPAGAATTAAMLGPLRERLRGRRVGLIVCGANIDHESFATFLSRGSDRLSGMS